MILADFVTSSWPWFIRGGNFSNTTNAGVLTYNNTNGGTNNNVSFRAVIDYDTKKCFSFLKGNDKSKDPRDFIPFPKRIKTKQRKDV